MMLHLANDYSGSTVYKNLIVKLDEIGLEQIIYVPIRSDSLINKNLVEFNSSQSKIFYRPILSSYTRIDYKAKKKRVLKDIKETIDFTPIKIIHAHTWFSDGAIAYELYKKYKTPYIVTIRNTDINLFYKYIFFLRKYGKEILEHASKIIFISPIYKKRFFNLKGIDHLRDKFIHKTIVLPNGIDDFWIENTDERKKNISKTPQLLYIGRFTKSKNIMKLIQAVESLEEQGVVCKLKLIGGGGKAEASVLNYIKNKSNITYHGKILDKERLKEFYLTSDIYTMPSKAETFGLVYIEALSQGIPVVFTKNEGIDGLYNSNIGEAVDCNNLQSIVEGIKKITFNYNDYNFKPHEIVNKHDWKKIAMKYQKIYKTITE